MKNLKISKKLILSFSIVVFVFLLSIASGLYSIGKIKTKLSDFYNHPYKSHSVANEMKISMEGMLRNVLLAASTYDETITQEALSQVTENNQKLQEKFEIIQNSFKGDKQWITDLKNKLDELAPHREHVIELAKANKAEEAAEYMSENNIPIFKEASAILDKIINFADTRGEELIKSTNQSQVFTTLLLFTMSVISVIISIIFCWYITRSITKPLEEIQIVSEELSKGNLGVEIHYEAKDELGKVSFSLKNTINTLNKYLTSISKAMKLISEGDFTIELNTDFEGDFVTLRDSIEVLVNSINNTMFRIKQSAEQVTGGSHQVAEGAQSLAQASNEQAGSAEELSATVNELSQQVNNTAKNAKKANEKSKTAENKIEKCNKQMQQMIDAMNDIQKISYEINTIIENIEDIASQTNLLSLNAAIEAARAGEAGKGFAVVAEEIRELANESANAVKNTSELIERNMKAVKNGIEVANSAASSMDIIVEDTTDVSLIIDEISSAASFQAASISQVTKTIDEIVDIIQLNSSSSQESSAASEELLAQAQTMKESIEQFKIKDMLE